MTAFPARLAVDPTTTGSWTLSPTLSTVTFGTKAMWVLPVTGSFGISAGHGVFTVDGRLSGSLAIDAASVDTGNKRRDKHLRTADFLDVDTHPSFTYTVTGARPGAGDDEVVLDGVFTAHGVERALTVPAHITVVGTDATVTAELELDRGDWGVLETARGASRATRVSIRAVFVKSGA